MSDVCKDSESGETKLTVLEWRDAAKEKGPSVASPFEYTPIYYIILAMPDY